jgi:hypothetical protein
MPTGELMKAPDRLRAFWMMREHKMIQRSEVLILICEYQRKSAAKKSHRGDGRRAENTRRKTLNGSTIVTQAQTKHFRRPRFYGTMAFIPVNSKDSE